VNENGKNTTLWPGFTWQFRLQTRWFDARQYICESEWVAVGELSPAT
jgi:cyclohexanone monooxygenase